MSKANLDGLSSRRQLTNLLWPHFAVLAQYAAVFLGASRA